MQKKRDIVEKFACINETQVIIDLIKYRKKAGSPAKTGRLACMPLRSPMGSTVIQILYK